MGAKKGRKVGLGEGDFCPFLFVVELMGSLFEIMKKVKREQRVD